MKKNQKGFTLIEGLLAVIFLSLIGFIGYYVWHTNQKDNKTVNSTSLTEKTTAVNNYQGWKDYCSTNEKACFKYPTTWKVEDSCSNTTDCPNVDSIRFSTPDSSTIYYTSSVAGIGGDCEQGVVPNVVYTKVEKLSNNSGLYLVESTRSDVTVTNFGLADTVKGSPPKVGDTGSCFNYFSFASKNTKNAGASFNASIENSAKPADLKNIELALSSFKYQ